jgi:hypothetical protein
MLAAFPSTRSRILSAFATTPLWALVFLPILAPAGCGDDPVEVKPSLGVIEVTALAEGPGPIPDSFAVFINGGRSGSVLPNGILAIPSLPRGAYQVSLLGDEENCWYGESTRRVTVVPNDTSFTTFLVRCR